MNDKVWCGMNRVYRNVVCDGSFNQVDIDFSLDAERKLMKATIVVFYPQCQLY